VRLLIVEDDTRLRTRLMEHFVASGWVVDEAAEGRQAQYLGAEYPYDLAIVDLGLPDLPGIDLIRQWRTFDRTFPVLILTARADWEEKVAGLEAGADDYVTKPFHLEEVDARINALLRRVAGRASALVDYGPIAIDFSARRVLRAGELLEMTTFEYNTLAYLAHRAGEVVSKSELTEHLYAQDFERDSNVIEVFIGRLRKKLDPRNEFKPIRTVRGAGYCFSLEPGSG
jgi:two-component system response regulator PhoP